jgi:hypothetical protein
VWYDVPGSFEFMVDYSAPVLQANVMSFVGYLPIISRHAIVPDAWLGSLPNQLLEWVLFVVRHGSEPLSQHQLCSAGV